MADVNDGRDWLQLIEKWVRYDIWTLKATWVFEDKGENARLSCFSVNYLLSNFGKD